MQCDPSFQRKRAFWFVRRRGKPLRVGDRDVVRKNLRLLLRFSGFSERAPFSQNSRLLGASPLARHQTRQLGAPVAHGQQYKGHLQVKHTIRALERFVSLWVASLPVLAVGASRTKITGEGVLRCAGGPRARVSRSKKCTLNSGPQRAGRAKRIVGFRLQLPCILVAGDNR